MLSQNPLLQANRAEVLGLAVADKLVQAEAGLVLVQWQELASALVLAGLG